MKIYLIVVVMLSSIIASCNAQPYPNKSSSDIQFPRDSALINIKDSILIGKYFVAVKGSFFTNYVPLNPINARVHIKSFEDAEEISLQVLKQNFVLSSSDSLYPVLNGDIALLKKRNAASSTVYNINVHSLKGLPKIDILQEGDIIAFIGMKSFNGKTMSTFPARWYKIIQ